MEEKHGIEISIKDKLRMATILFWDDKVTYDDFVKIPTIILYTKKGIKEFEEEHGGRPMGNRNIIIDEDFITEKVIANYVSSYKEERKVA